MWLLAQLFFSAKVWQHTVVKKGASDGHFFFAASSFSCNVLGQCFAVQGHIFNGLKFFFMCIDIVINSCLMEEVLNL